MKRVLIFPPFISPLCFSRAFPPERYDVLNLARWGIEFFPKERSFAFLQFFFSRTCNGIGSAEIIYIGARKSASCGNMYRVLYDRSDFSCFISLLVVFDECRFYVIPNAAFNPFKYRRNRENIDTWNSVWDSNTFLRKKIKTVLLKYWV